MKFIIGPRTSGVTTDLILEVSKFNQPILVPNEASAKHIKTLCDSYDIPCPEIYTFREIKNPMFFKGKRIETIHVSDVDAFIKDVLNDYGYMGSIGTVSVSLDSFFK